MYKPIDKLQRSFLDFNQPMGLHMNPDNRWIKMADRIPWDEFEIKYAELFPSDTGNVAKPLRMALGALIIQTKFQFSDRELVEQITENPYLQYFIGLPSYQEKAPFDASTLVLFRKRISAEMLMEVNEYLLAHKDDDNNTPPSSGSSNDSDISCPAVQGVEYCDKLFAYERHFKEKGYSYKQIKNGRLKKEKPVIEAFLSWLEKQKTIKGSKFATEGL